MTRIGGKIPGLVRIGLSCIYSLKSSNKILTLKLIKDMWLFCKENSRNLGKAFGSSPVSGTILEESARDRPESRHKSDPARMNDKFSSRRDLSLEAWHGVWEGQ